jgi:hypothetical protein
MAGDHARAIIKMADKHLAFVFNYASSRRTCWTIFTGSLWGSAACDESNL